MTKRCPAPAQWHVDRRNEEMHCGRRTVKGSSRLARITCSRKTSLSLFLVGIPNDPQFPLSSGVDNARDVGGGQQLQCRLQILYGTAFTMQAGAETVGKTCDGSCFERCFITLIQLLLSANAGQYRGRPDGAIRHNRDTMPWGDDRGCLYGPAVKATAKPSAPTRSG